MISPILTTKLYLPPLRPGLTTRSRLIEHLNSGLDYKLTLISAPAGFGKTTLVSDWLRQLDRPFAWLSLDDGDNDPVRFLTYLLTALQEIDPAIGEAARSLLETGGAKFSATSSAYRRGEITNSDEASTEAGDQLASWIKPLLTLLLNDLLASPEAVLVLDDYHLLTNPFIHEMMGFLLEQQPSSFHLVITTRVDPPLPLARWRGQGQLNEIRQDALRFTPTEALDFFNQTMSLKLPVEVVEALDARTEGWVAGLQLAALALPAAVPQGENQTEQLAEFVASFSGSHRYVIDYLVDEVIRQQPKPVQQFLRQTAILDRMSASLCQAVTGREDSREILRQLEQANLFLIPLDDHRQWYRYHHLFADFLRTDLDAAQQVELHRLAAAWFQANEFSSEAIKHLLAAQDLAKAVSLIEQTAVDVLQTGQLTTFQGWLEALPDDLVRNNGLLATYQGWTLWLLGQGDAAESYAQAAAVSLVADDVISQGKLYTLQAYLSLSRDDEATTRRLAKVALELLDETESLFRCMALLALAEVHSALGDMGSAIQTYREVVQLGRQHSLPQLTITTLSELAQHLNFHGERPEAIAICQQIIETCVDARGKPLPIAGLAYTLLGEMEFQACNYTQAGQYLYQGLELCQQQGLVAYILIAQMAVLQFQYGLEQIEAALQTAQDSRRLARQANFASYVTLFDAIEADLHLYQGNLTAATQWADRAGLSPADSPNPLREYEYLFYAQVLVAQSRAEEALTLLNKLAHSAQAGERNFFLITVSIQQALTQAKVGAETQALTHLETALNLAQPGGYRLPFLEEGETVINLLLKIRARFQGIVAPSFIDQILQDAEAAGIATNIAPTQTLVDPLSERELEILGLIASGLANQEIASQLMIAKSTVKTHLVNIYSKLGVHHRTKAVARARELGLL